MQSAVKERSIGRYWFVLNQEFRFQTNACNRCHDLLMMSLNLSNVAISKIKNAENYKIKNQTFRSIISGTEKRKVTKLLPKIDFTEKNGTL